MNEKFRLRLYLSILILAMITGVSGFMLSEGSSFIDAVYFTVVTIATVGYGDVHPTTTAGKIVAMVLIVTGVGAFVGLVANGMEIMLDNREKRSRMEKLNMVIGLFYSEAGRGLLSLFSRCDGNIDAIKKDLAVNAAWSDRDFSAAARRIAPDYLRYDITCADLVALRDFLVAKSEFFLRLMENPTLLEHEEFTEMLMAGFHLQEELASRDDLVSQPHADREHLAGDIKRFYLMLAREWLVYMRYLKTGYPYLFSLAARLNPFDGDASAVIRD